jgi:site-specific recombinase XerD
VQVTIPIPAMLREALAATKTGDLTFLINSYGQRWTKKSLGNWIRKVCDKAGCPSCTSHGLRKAAATRAAENGATEQEMMAMFGWMDPRTAAIYTRAAARARMSRENAHKMLPRQVGNG